MLPIIFVVLIALAIFASHREKRHDYHEASYYVLCFFSSIAAGIIAFVMLLFGCHLFTSNVIDDKIALLEEENRVIEERIDALVCSYMEHEGNTYRAIKPGDGMTQISTFPELNSDILVVEQIDTYIANHENVVELKKEKISLGIYSWWLYFGN